MPEKEEHKREHWGSGIGFILAATGSAIGLGNIWKFPYIAGENGGGAFVLVYLVCICIVGIPVMLCEMALGRHTQRNPIGAFRAISPKRSLLAHLIGLGMVLTGIGLLCFHNYGIGTLMLILGAAVFRFSWTVVGFAGVFTGFIILSYYSVVAGWIIGYFFKALNGTLNFPDVAAAGTEFDRSTGSIGWGIGFHLMFMASCALVVWSGVRSGIERWSKILMPVLFLLLYAIILRSMTLPGAIKGISFLLSPDFSKLSAHGVLLALGHAFFTLSLGMGAMTTYGSYVPKRENLFVSCLMIVGLDTLAALLAGLAIFPAVFALNMAPNEGPGLIFKILPVVMNQIPLGGLWMAMFFLLIFIAALTSGISLLEVVVAAMIDELKMPRHLAVVLSSTVIAVLGCLCAVSVDNWDMLPHLHAVLVKTFGVAQGSFFAFMDNISSNWLLPLGGLMTSLFVGWIWGTRAAVDEIRHGAHNFADVHLLTLLSGLRQDPNHNNPEYHVFTLAATWGIFIRFISPVAIAIAF
ncbi:MAG: sodium-dependent transporter, partial [Victivallales bacterium]|nr:sodium-dependent transporter [Victivallales bacterium]